MLRRRNETMDLQKLTMEDLVRECRNGDDGKAHLAVCECRRRERVEKAGGSGAAKALIEKATESRERVIRERGLR